MELHFAPFLAGVLAGANGTVIGHPFDTLKTRFQVGTILKGKHDLLFVRQLYRGILPPLLTSGAINSVNFFMFENFRSWLCRAEGGPKTKFANKNDLDTIFVAGSMSGSIVSIVSNPISIIKIRQQVASTGGVMQCAKDVLTNSGPRAFYRGYSTMLLLDASRGLYLTIYEVMKRTIVAAGESIATAGPAVLVPYSDNQRTDSLPQAGHKHVASFTDKSTSTRMLAAALTGMVSWCIIFPIDVVRVRLHHDFAAIKYANWWDCCAKTWAEGGVKVFYRGLGYTLMRAGPVSAVSLTTYECAKDVLERM